MPCYNAAAHLPRSIGSVVAQSFADWELIAVNDGSTDNTLSWLQSHDDARLRIHTQSNKGVSTARNTGLAMAQGHFVAFLDADDTWSPDFLALMVSALQNRPDAVLAYCGWQNIGPSEALGEPFIPPDYETPDKAQTLFAGCRWPIHAVLLRNDALKSTRGFQSHLTNAEDYALWLELAIPSPITQVRAVLAYYHFHGGFQASAHKARAALQFWQVQQDYLAQHPEFSTQLGARLIKVLTHGTLLHKGYMLYWKRDLQAARQIFRHVMRQGYGTLTDWKYMLPSWLPESWHKKMIALLETRES